MHRTAPSGSWPSPLAADALARAGRRLSQPQLGGGAVWWLEGRPEEGGRQVVMRLRSGGAVEEVTPRDVNVRSTVHEYGGGDYRVAGGELFCVEAGRPGIQRCSAGGTSTLPGSAVAGARHADFERSPDGRWLLAVEEQHGASEREPRNRLVAFDLAGGAPRPLAEGHDFFSTPRFSPDGTRIAWLSWDHPDMPWDATTLWVAPFGERGAGPPRAVAGGGGESVFQPGWSPGGVLTFVSDRSGWWNLYQLREGGGVPLCPREAEFGLPQWVFGMRTWDFVDEDVMLCTVGRQGARRLARLTLSDGALHELGLPYGEVDGLRVAQGRAVFVGASPTSPPAICLLDLASGRVSELRRSSELALAPGDVSHAEAIDFPSEGGRRAHAFLYRPANARVQAPPGERPPLLVKSHGGPTAAASPSLKPAVQYWTSRGFAVVDVDYAGSTGYGRAYRDALRGAWGVADVDDCVHAALHLAAQGLVDRDRLAITGGSAGGFTTLCALTFRDVFAAGASHYGIGDLEALARDTHKFESRYLDGLVGPWPERRDLYLERSPIHHTERLSCPVIFFQGLEDRVVPPSQTEAMVAALARRGIPHAYVPFPGEQHGFRRAENICRALEGELFFYARVLGFPTDVAPGVRIERGAGGAARALGGVR